MTDNITTSVSDGNITQRSTDPYPVGGFSEPIKIELEIAQAGRLTMAMTQEMVDATADDGTQVKLLMGYTDGGLWVWVTRPDDETRIHLRIDPENIIHAVMTLLDSGAIPITK